MASFVEPHIQSIDDGGLLSSDDLVNLDKISGDFALRRHLMSIKVWRLTERFCSAIGKTSLEGILATLQSTLL